ncbi:hypothetical protein B0T24DRAFT_372941 [Lasiosphaeria ovina]|uniref:Uncharacterized protein n=1 Tax=Lasiosphaeria ovina TaxID=92902 RepID=A0AAE0N1P0_9PEZI|nr:hypothetical protein B0T24DRAFT_372941 [Lasiosphaeria ovina]
MHRDSALSPVSGLTQPSISSVNRASLPASATSDRGSRSNQREKKPQPKAAACWGAALHCTAAHRVRNLHGPGKQRCQTGSVRAPCGTDGSETEGPTEWRGSRLFRVGLRPVPSAHPPPFPLPSHHWHHHPREHCSQPRHWPGPDTLGWGRPCSWSTGLAGLRCGAGTLRFNPYYTEFCAINPPTWPPRRADTDQVFCTLALSGLGLPRKFRGLLFPARL